MALRNKWEQLAALKPDVAIIQECEQDERWPQGGYTAALWHGGNRHKGIAIVTFGDWQLRPVAHVDASIEYVLPAEVLGPRSFRILGVWTKPAAIRERSYIGQMLYAAEVYGPWLAGGAAVVAGDLNSNAVWDRPQRARHAATVARLGACGLGSAYHAFFGCGQGAERHGTWYNHKRIERSFHLDYCFVPRNWLPHVYRVEVGRPHAWLAYSDHCPLIVDVAMVDAA